MMNTRTTFSFSLEKQDLETARKCAVQSRMSVASFIRQAIVEKSNGQKTAY